MSITKHKLSLRKGLTVITSAATIMMLSGVALVPFGASADHTTEHTIEQLLAQIASLQAQLIALQGGTQAPSTACNFTRSLFLGVSGEDVRCLQQYLNGAGHTLAASGAGSPGNETTFYGPLTQAGVASWQAANGVAPAVGYFGPISTAKYNSLVAGGVVPTPTPTGPLSVSLAPDNPSAKTITLNSTGVEFLKVRFTGSGTINSLTLKRQGAGDTNDFANVYVYDGAKRLTSGKTFSSSSGETTFVSLDVSVSGSKDLSIVADMDSTNNTAGNVNYVQLLSVSASETVSGAPLSGNNMTSSGASSGSVVIAKAGSLANPTVGQKQAEISEFKITANTEAASLRRLTMIDGGSIGTDGLSNVVLKTGANSWNGTVSGDYLVFDLGSGFTISKGGNAVFQVLADIGGKPTETVDLYFENDADTLAMGDQYGQGMAVDDSALDSAADATTLTLQGGVLTITFNGPTASNISTDATDATLLRYSMTAASNIEVRKTEFVICASNDGDSTFDDASDETNLDDITDVKVWNEDTNQVVMGPKDGTAFDDVNDTDSCPDSQSGAGETFTDVLDLSAGQTYNLKVTADFDTTNGGNFDSDDIVRIVLDRYDDDTPDITIMKYPDTNTSVADADIVPNGDISGQNMTLQGSSLTLGLAAAPTSKTYVKGTQGADMVGITFAASLGSGLNVTDITLTGYIEDESGDTHNEGVDTTDSGVSVGNLVQAVKLYDGDTGALISATPSSNNLSVKDTGTVGFNNLNWAIGAGETKTLLVKADLSTNDASGSNGDFISFDINATTDVTATDDSNNTVNAGTADPNGATAPTVNMTIKNSGTLTVAPAPDTPITGAKYWGQTDTEFSRFRYTATDDSFFIERLNINTGDTAADATNNVGQVKLEYKNEAGSTLTKTGSLNTDGSVSFAFTGTERPYVGAGTNMDVKVLANMKARSQSSPTSEVNFSLDISGGNGDEFRAVGASGTLVDGTDSNITNEVGNNQYVYRVFPEFIQDTLAASEPLGTKDALKFTIKAHGTSDARIFFDDPTSTSLRFEVVASGQTNANLTTRLYDVSTGELLASATLTNPQDDSLKPSITFSDWEKDLEITGGSQKSFRVEVAFQNFLDKSDFFQITLRDDEANPITYVDGASTTSVATANESNQVTATAGVFRLLPMNGPIFTKQ